MILFESTLEKMIQKGSWLPCPMFMKSRLRILILLCLNRPSVALAAQQADVLKPYEGSILHAIRTR